jgi:hypothetical protein
MLPTDSLTQWRPIRRPPLLPVKLAFGRGNALPELATAAAPPSGHTPICGISHKHKPLYYRQLQMRKPNWRN